MKKRLLDIGTFVDSKKEEKHLFAYDFENKEIYELNIKIDSKRDMGIGIGTSLGIGFGNITFIFANSIQFNMNPILWFSLSLVFFVLLSYLIYKTIIYRKQKIVNWKKFQNRTTLDAISKTIIKEIKEITVKGEETGAIMGCVFIMFVFSLGVIGFGFTYLNTESDFVTLYLAMLMLSLVLTFFWIIKYIFETRKARKKFLEEIEKYGK